MTVLESTSSSRDRTFTFDAIQIAKGATWFGVGMAVSTLLEYVIQGIIAVSLGPSDFGLFSIGFRIFTIGLTVAGLALPNAVAHFVPGYQMKGATERVGQIVTTTLWLTLLSGILVGVILFLAAGPIVEHVFREQGLLSVLRLFAVAVPAAATVLLLAGLLRGLKQSRDAALLTSGYDRGFRLGFIVLFLTMGLGLRAPVLAYVPSSILVLLLGLRLLRRSIRRISVRPSADVTKVLFNYSWPLHLSQVLSAASIAIQPLMLGYFLDARSVGLFSVAALITTGLSAVLMASNFLYLPVISEIASGGEMTRVRRLYQLVTRAGFIVVLPASLLALLLPQPFLELLGAQYSEGAWALRYLVIGSLVAVGVGAVGSTLLATGQTRVYLLLDVIGTMASIGLGLMLIPTLGLVGAAIARALTNIAWNLLTLFVVYKRYRMHPFSRHYLYAVGAALGCMLPLYPFIRLAVDLTPWSLAVIVPAYTGLTLGLLVQFRLLDADSQALVGVFFAIGRRKSIAVATRLANAVK